MIRDALRVRDAVQRMVDTASTVNIETLADPESANRILAGLQADSTQAADALSSPLWAAATHLPQVGYDISAIRILTDTISELTYDGLPELLLAATFLHNLDVSNTDPNQLASVFNNVRIGDAALANSISRIQEIDQSQLHPEIAEPIGEILDQLVVIRSATATVASASGLLNTLNQLLSGWSF